MKILLATDGSEYSEGAARFLTCLDFSPDDEITVLNVVSWVPFRYDMESYYESLKEIKKDIAPRILDSVVDILRPVKAKISIAIVDGSPEKDIIKVAEEAGMDMIVMGSRGIKGMKSIIIGSVTKAVALNSPKPVFVAKLPVRAINEKVRVLFATDGSDYSAAAGKMLAEVPFSESAELTIMNVIWSDFSDIPERFVLEINDRVKKMVADARSQEFIEAEKVLEEARKPLNKRFRKIETLIKVGDPSSEILAAAEKMKADIIVVGCRGLRGIRGMMGSVSRNILTHSTCSVILGKACRG